MTIDLLSTAADAVRLAKRAGASSADAVVVSSRNQDVSLRHGVIERLERSESLDLGLRVFVGHSSAIMAGSVLSPEGLHRLVERAMAMAKLAPPDPFSGLAETSQLATHIPDLDLADDSAIAPDEIQSLARRAEDAALAVKGVTRSNGATSGFGYRDAALVTSNGFSRGWRRSNFGISASVVAGEGTAMERDYDWHGSTHFNDLEQPEKIGTSAGNRAVLRLHPRKVPSQTVPVIYDRRISTTLVGHLLSAINGSAIARGTSFLKEDMGKPLFRPAVSIIDDPHRRRGLASRPVDGEGLPTRQMALIDKGVLTSWVMDLRAARQLGLAPTGHASRGVSSPPSSTTSNVHMQAGTRSPADFMRGMKRGLLVTEFIGSTINMVTGDYSRGASGFWIEDGEIAFPVSEVTVGGNLRDMFKALEPATDLEMRFSTNAPSCFLGEMTIAGR